MALADAAAPDRNTSPSPNGLSSNNPFRNRLSTASPSSPRSSDPTQQTLPPPIMSKNPFLDPSDAPAPATNGAVVNGDGNTAVLAADIFKDLSLQDAKPAFSNGPLPPRGPPPRSGTLPSQPRPLGPDDRRDRPRGPLRDPNSPQKRPEHRRRASESSMMEHERRDRGNRDRADRPPRTESEERRRRERRREREERYRAEKERMKKSGEPKSGEPKKSRRPRHLDIIDQLDVTGVYGQGLFHHDGPFDACNPHRNAKKDRRAPLQAFPADSMNMSLGGAGPLNNRLNLDMFHGRTEEGFNDYSATRKPDTTRVQSPMEQGQPTQYVNPTDRTEQVHGEETYGLGTSTFLEGAPASKRALQRRESEEQAMAGEVSNLGGGLQRKKSLAQRIRGMSASRPRAPGESLRSPDARYNNSFELSAEPTPPIAKAKALSGGGMARAVYSKENEINPFDNEYDKAFEKKGTQIKIAEQEKPNVGRARAPSSPKGSNLTRSVTAEAAVASPSEEKPSGGGFLTRMKSLKGPKKSRPEIRKVDVQE